MLKPCHKIATLVNFGVLGILILFQGCATPIEIKKASMAQMELIDSVDSAVMNVQTALDQFHRDKQKRITEEGRMLIARNAINVASSKSNSMVTADQLFNTYKSKIEPWVDNAFKEPFIDERITDLEKKIKAASDPLLKVAMQNDIDDLKLLKSNLKKKPKPVKEIESIIIEDLNNEKKTAEHNREMLEILRGQVALMKAMHGKVDDWLSIDITVTQDQADALKDSFNSAYQAIKGGAK